MTGHDPNIMAVLELLAERFPKYFSIFERRRRPLKIGVHLDILAALDGAVTADELRRALRAYVANKIYRSRLYAGAARIDLGGEPAGIVTPEQVPQKTPQQPINKPKPQRIGLAGLKAAALQRKASAS
jgi:ProP effector